ncbi:MFS transporter [Patescibacteria group bacterium]|nr:MFS transporter [Patescibacteria group bacterium]
MKLYNFHKLLIASYGIATFSEGVLMPIYAIFVQRIGGDILEASGAISIFLFVSGLTTILIHRSDWGQKHRIKLMVYGWLLWVIGIGGYFFISNIYTLFGIQIVVALGNAIANPAFDAELDDSINRKSKSYSWGIFEGIQDIANSIAAILGGIIASFFGFRVLIAFMFITAVVSFFIILYYVKIKNESWLNKIFFK